MTAFDNFLALIIILALFIIFYCRITGKTLGEIIKGIVSSVRSEEIVQEVKQ